MTDKKSRFENLRNKYLKDTPPEFPIQLETYDIDTVNRKIKELELELQEQIILSKKLDTNSEEKINTAKTFLKNNKSEIESQFNTLSKLEEDLTLIIEDNKQKQEADKEYYKLIKSNEYKILAKNMKNVKTKIKNINNLLIKEGINDHLN